ncbi:MAG TPA: type II toxin-antitoxin system VapC family toxin [Thermoleophilaceae bacterium]|nr:type II toxin-antitoxin system VapC family toxin [Thermoleophilaceae bacterium]
MNSHMIVYMDGSALIKRVESGSDSELATDVWSSADRIVSTELACAEARSAVDVPQKLLDTLEIVETDARIAGMADELAERHGLTEAESVHLAVALSVEAPRVVVATWDPALATAAAECGLAVVPREPALSAA